MRLEDITVGQRLSGVVPAESVEVVGVRWSGPDALALTFDRSDGRIERVVLYRPDEPRLDVAKSARRPFDAPGADFRLVAEAQRIRLAGLHDPMLAVASSDVQPLPHQIRAVYGDMLPRSPLRFLLADDPGAGKTIMAGLLIKELLLREDVRRCLVVAPGGLVDQWQDELWQRFALEFDILTTSAIDAAVGRSVFDARPRLIARMDQLARNDDLLAQVDEAEFDLVVVDEAHRMSAHWFGGKLQRSRRFELGERLGRRARHLLLMTATPHAGKDDDFQLFLSLLDRDLFEGRHRRGARIDAQSVMRRMVKEDLVTFDGRRLFPERVAQTVPYRLSPAEAGLYEEVTAYVRDEMGRAERLDGQRRNTVGFALTVLQRRLASSPEAICRSLERRVARLERRRHDLANGIGVRDDQALADVGGLGEFGWIDPEEHDAAETEAVEAELVDAATAARTVTELDAELTVLRHLVDVARRVRSLDTDRKWVELRTILEDDVLAGPAGPTSGGAPRKLIVFTEHRDTLEYLRRRVGALIGRADAVQAIHGGVRRAVRRQITEEFTHNPECQVLLATDAAGEGLNLQAAHLVVNYDLPWNPNRIEQRFGRVHRIGQTEVCRLWNLVAEDTREGAVFLTLLAKIDQQREAYQGRVFDVLGEAFAEVPLRDLLLEAIRYGDRPEVKARMEEVIDRQAGEGVHDLLHERALAAETLPPTEVAALRRRMEEARARRLQPHFVGQAFLESLRRLGGRVSRREAGRYEIAQVPASVRGRADQERRAGPVATRYERVTFDLDRVDLDGSPRAELVAPGHPLHDTVHDEVLERFGEVLDRGAVLVSPAVVGTSLLVGVIEQVLDATGQAVAKRFGYVFVDAAGGVVDAGPAPYLDCVAAPPETVDLGALPWLSDVEARVVDWIVGERLPTWLADVELRRRTELDRLRSMVEARMNGEIDRLAVESMAAAERVQAGRRVRETPETLDRKRAELETRLERRLRLIAQQRHLSTVPPRVVAAAVIVPPDAAGEVVPLTAPMRAVATAEVERRAVDAVLVAERALGREPREMPHHNPGYDVESVRSDDPMLFIEVKGRIAGAEDFFITHTEIRYGQNAAPHYRLALVRVDPRGPEHDEVRYRDDPFGDVRLDGFDAEGVRGHWAKTWARGRPPF